MINIIQYAVIFQGINQFKFSNFCGARVKCECIIMIDSPQYRVACIVMLYLKESLCKNAGEKRTIENDTNR